MRILVTGHRGFIGSHMVRELNLLGHEVQVYDWADSNGSAFPVVDDQDWVIHLGANSSTTDRNVVKVLAQNLDFSIWLVDECAQYDVNLQYASSASIYGSSQTFKETDAPDPRSPYAWSKYLFERYVNSFDWNITVQGFRYFNVYGDNEEHKKDQASPYSKFKWQARDNNYIELFEGSDSYLRDFVPVEQVIDHHIKFLDIPESGVWNIGTGKPVSFLEVAKQFDVSIREIPMPDNLKQSYQPYTCADMTKTNLTLKKYGL